MKVEINPCLLRNIVNELRSIDDNLTLISTRLWRLSYCDDVNELRDKCDEISDEIEAEVKRLRKVVKILEEYVKE